MKPESTNEMWTMMKYLYVRDEPMTEFKPEFTKFVTGKGPNSNRIQVLQVLGWAQNSYRDGTSLSVAELMERLDATEEFIQDLLKDMLNEGLIKIDSVVIAKHATGLPKTNFVPESG